MRCPAIIGHRGAMARAPENTLASFELALVEGADGLECDVHLSADGQVVVMHDFTLERTTNGSGAVASRTMAELRQLDAGSWHGPTFRGEPVPSLSQFLEVLARHRTRRSSAPMAVIELKAGSARYPGIEAAVLAELERADYLDSALIISFDHLAVQESRRLQPRVAGGVLYFARPVAAPSLAQAAGADWLGPSVEWVSSASVQAAHEAGLQVFVWTAQRPEQARDLAAWGVDAFGANDPGAMRAALSR